MIKRPNIDAKEYEDYKEPCIDFHPAYGSVVREQKKKNVPVAPMTEIRRDHKQVFGLIQVRCEDLAVLLLAALIHIAHHDRNDADISAVTAFEAYHPQTSAD